MEDMDRKNFEDLTFDEMPAEVVCSNFRHCIFNASTRFDRCNLIGCVFNVQCEFHLSNVIDDEDEPKEA